MKPFGGYKAERQTAREQLPVGAHVAKILEAKEISYDWGNVLQISFDITEGGYKDFFKADYNARQQEDKKWRGTYRLNVPKDDGSEKDGWTKNTFNGAMYAIEQSNPGYHWDWNEAGLKGKTVGVIMRNKEWEINGNTGWTTEAGMLTDVESIRSGKFKLMKDKPLKNKPVQQVTQFVEIEDDSELPF